MKRKEMFKPATIPLGDVIRERSVFRFEGKRVVYSTEGTTAGARSKRRRRSYSDRRLGRKGKVERRALFDG